MVLERYSLGQRLAFLGLAIGLIVCAGSGIAPYWKVAEVSMNYVSQIFDVEIPLIGHLKLFKYHAGLFFYCAEVPLMEEKTCQGFELDKGSGLEKLSVITFLVGTLMLIICTCAACCRMCCCDGGRTVFHGIAAFIAGALYVTTVAAVVSHDNESWGFKLEAEKYGWALYTFAAGSFLIVVSSFTLCCAYPESRLYGMVSNHLPAPLVISTSFQQGSQATYTQFQNEPTSVHVATGTEFRQI